MRDRIFGVVLAGGWGKRLWPRSRRNFPKYLLPDFTIDGESLLKKTVNRLLKLTRPEDVFIVTWKGIEDAIRDEFPFLPSRNVICEPFPKNTAPAIGFTAIRLSRLSPSNPMVVLPADHYIPDENLFHNTLKKAIDMALKGDYLLTIGIRPTRPETGYGYIKAGRKIEDGIYHVEQFIEKPSLEKAKRLIKRGEYLWNSGMFIWRVDVILSAIKKHMPSLYSGLLKLKETKEFEVIEEVYEGFKDESIDYGVLEKADNIIVVEGNFKWDDLGSWLSFERVWDKDEKGNIVKAKFLGLDTKNSIIFSNDHLIATLDVSNIIIVSTGEITLVANKERAQDVKKIVEKIERMKDLKDYL